VVAGVLEVGLSPDSAGSGVAPDSAESELFSSEVDGVSGDSESSFDPHPENSSEATRSSEHETIDILSGERRRFWGKATLSIDE
jgi:hypothetical protein